MAIVGLQYQTLYNYREQTRAAGSLKRNSVPEPDKKELIAGIARAVLQEASSNPRGPLGQGVAKRVWSYDDENVVVEPTKKAKLGEVQQDFSMAERIRQAASGNDSHLAVGQPKHQDVSKGIYCTKRASGDLKGTLRTASVAQVTDLGHQMLTGLRQLQDAGYVHGDLKTDNFLIFREGGKDVLKLTDWGKTKKLGEREVASYEGNRDFIPGENTLSRKSEVYSAGLLLIRMLEAPHLNDDNGHMLAQPKYPRAASGLQKTNRGEGIVKFLSRSRVAPQDCNGARRITSALSAKVGATGTVSTEQTREVHAYIDALCDKYPDQKDQLRGLLRQMLHPDPAKRCSMQDTEALFGAIFSNSEE